MVPQGPEPDPAMKMRQQEGLAETVGKWWGGAHSPEPHLGPQVRAQDSQAGPSAESPGCPQTLLTLAGAMAPSSLPAQVSARGSRGLGRPCGMAERTPRARGHHLGQVSSETLSPPCCFCSALSGRGSQPKAVCPRHPALRCSCPGMNPTPGAHCQDQPRTRSTRVLPALLPSVGLRAEVTLPTAHLS